MKNLIQVLSVLLILSLAMGCVPTGKKVTAEKRRVFGATYMNMTNPFFIVLDEGIREIVEVHGDKLISYDPASDQLKQIGQIEEFVRLGVDAIFLNPVDWHLVKPALESARKAGIPIINVDAPVYDLDLVDCVVTSDNVKAGQLLAEDLLKRLPRARIALLDHLQAKSAIDRKDGFLAVLASSGEYSVVSRFSCEGNIEPAMTGMESILRSGARIDAVFATNDPMATGAVAALVAAGLDGKVVVYGVDGAPYAKKMIADGRMTATAAQSPVGIGREAADVAYRILAGEKVKKTFLVPVFLIDGSNVASYGVEGWQ